jgi:very-short-patch-repair endonuclease
MRRTGISTARRLRRRPTDAEIRMWYLLRGRRLAAFKFRRQVAIGPWVVDFLCPSRHLVVEIDGGQHAENQRDIARDRELVARGYRVVRYWNHDVLGNTDGVLTDLLAILRPDNDG